MKAANALTELADKIETAGVLAKALSHNDVWQPLADVEKEAIVAALRLAADESKRASQG